MAPVATKQPDKPRDVTKVAFGQITDLGSEFRQLRADDQAHTKQLAVDVHLREKLQQELRQAEDRLGADNAELAQETTGIVPPGMASQVAGTADVQNETAAATIDAEASLVQATISSKAPSDPIADDVGKDVKAINSDITDLHSRDTKQIKALKSNAGIRMSLSEQIAKEREELERDAGGLATNLQEIQGLVDPRVVDASAAAMPTQNDPLPQQQQQQQQ